MTPSRLVFLPLLLSCVLSILTNSFSHAQSTRSAFDCCLAYSQAIDELHVKFSSLRKVREQLFVEQRQTLERLATTQLAVKQLAAEQIASQFALMQADFEVAILSSPLQAVADQPRAVDREAMNSNNVGSVDQRFRQLVEAVPRSSSRAALQRLTNITVTYDAIRHHQKTLNEAGRLAVERHLSVMQELERIAKESLEWEGKTLELFNSYWKLADVTGVKSDLELRAALRQCGRASDDNPGALLLKTVTLMRLDQPDEALQALERLVQVPCAQLLAFALRAEMLARAGQKGEAIAILRRLGDEGAHDYRMRVHRAQVYALVGEWKLAERDWISALKLGGSEVAVRRAVAFINTSSPVLTDRNKTTAFDSAHLATQLASDDWASALALAISAAASGKDQEALDAAETAAKLAIGDKQLFCQDVIEQLKNGSRPYWKF